MKNRKIIMLILTLLVLAAVSGCGKERPASDAGKLVAKIGKCDITVEDFQYDAGIVLSKKHIEGDARRAKEELLDELITKKLLLREAQAKNYDKNKDFMKEIERYWEQALLKLLIKEKTRELLQKVSVRDDEIAKEYENMKLEQAASIQPLDKMAPAIRSDIKRRKVSAAFTQWVSSLRNAAKVKIYEENLKNIKID